ncbi:alpha-(1-_3)-arabinofuranosyltransferase [Streptomyces sp. NBC_01808]|uniref:alpha-(1->3)-arabinofuranosyltransferase domain-containing protein n=1 Tax=Streptomyces sp. NBC_01808 TaxID=2975947 RepID=UPI002DD90212|nr:alpha-(1->3)-arabinofuranosyltransferase family protein [Streptomyces sp. NBC_01808]WSA37610.1 alpha-(1->3)-arabinofuranosyltransferase [Streptomyces sp. NBC_01808]
MTSTLPAQPATPGRPYSPPPPSGPAGARPPESRRSWRWPLGFWAFAFVAWLIPSAGKTTFETKLGVVVDPWKFAGDLGELWHDQNGFGGIHDQYFGYAFPMLPYYLLTDVAQIPTWLAERLWLSLVVTAAFWGALKLADRLGFGTPGTRVLGAVAYALWPVFTIIVGSTSAGALPGAVLPWVLLPLLDERLTPRVAAARSALIIPFMGGVNAASTLAALLPALLYVCTRTGSRRTKLLAWWLPGVLLACLWWIVPLLLLGIYGENFLPFIETAHNTTTTMSATEVLRGTGNWVAYLNFGEAWLPGGWTVATGWLPILSSVLAAGLGLAGLARRDLPERRWLVLTVMVVALLTLAGYGGALGAPFSGSVQDALDSWLSPFRNIYKFQPGLALALALGLAHIVAVAAERRGTRANPRRSAWVPAIASLVVLPGLLLPYANGDVLQPGAFDKLPKHWEQTADWLEEYSPDSRALVVPATAHGTYEWGKPIDQPLDVLAESRWAQRDYVPFGTAGSRRAMDAVDQALMTGGEVPGLQAFLARAGLHYVVVRNDLDPDQVGYVPPTTVKQTLTSSGYEKVAEFGPELTGGRIPEGTPLQIEGLFSRQRSVEIYQPADGEDLRPGPAGALNAADTAVLSGGPESLLQLSADPDWQGRPAVLAGDAHPGVEEPAVKVQADGLRRADTRFGVVNNNTSYTYTEDEKNPEESLQDPGDEPRMIVPEKGTEHQTTAVLDGAASVTASTSGNWMFHLPQFDPVNAFDGVPQTGWAEGNPDTSKGEWLQIDFTEPTNLEGTLDLTPLPGAGVRPEPVEVEVETPRGSEVSTLQAGGRTQSVKSPEGQADWLRITIRKTEGTRTGFAGAGFAEVEIPGVSPVSRQLRLPADAKQVAADAEQISLHRGSDLGGLNPAAAETGLQRRFESGEGEYTVTGKVLPVQGQELDALLDDLSALPEERISATAGSTMPLSPQLSPRNLVDKDLTTAWIAGADESLTLTWPEATEISEFVLAPAGGLSARPTEVEVSTPTGAQTVGVDANGWVRIPPVTTDRLDIKVTGTESLSVHNPFADRDVQLPVGLTEVYVPALGEDAEEDLRTEPVKKDEPFELECGSGPVVSVDGELLNTRAEGTLGDLVDRRPVDIELCPGDGEAAGPVELAAGRHAVAAGDGEALAVTDLTLTRGEPAAAAAGRDVEATDWAGDERAVTVGEGQDAYLTTYENYNDGWKATLDGEELESVRLDGWQQGFLVPADKSGEVKLEYKPAAWYDAGIFAGVAAILALLGLAFVRAGRREVVVAEPAPPAPGWVLGALVLTAVVAVVAGPYALIVPALALLARTRAGLLAPLALVAMAGAGVAALTGAGEAVRMDEGAFSGVAQALAVLALAAALVTAERPEPAGPETGYGPDVDPEAETAAFPAYGAGVPAAGAAGAAGGPPPGPGGPPGRTAVAADPGPDLAPQAEPDRPTQRFWRRRSAGAGAATAAAAESGADRTPALGTERAADDSATPPLGTAQDEPRDAFVPKPPIPLSGTADAADSADDSVDDVQDTPPADAPPADTPPDDGTPADRREEKGK